MNKPCLTVFTLGGTIAMSESNGHGVIPSLTGKKLIEAIPGLDALARISAESFRQLPSTQLQVADLEVLAAEIRTLYKKGQRGFVVTQGTDTIEETAFVLDRILDINAPVVFTGAMRNPTLVGADGSANLLAAVTVALSEEARGCGCLIVMNDEVHAARFVHKAHTSRPSAFCSPLCGPIGWVREGQVCFCTKPTKIPAMRVPTNRKKVRTVLVTMALGDDGTQVGALDIKKFDGVVVASAGGGHVSHGMASALEAVAQRVPVVFASRTGSGETLSQTYGYSGGEIDLQQRGLVRAGWLDAFKAKVLLTLMLRYGRATKEEMVDAFCNWGGGSG